MASATTLTPLAAPTPLFTPEQTAQWELGVSLLLHFWMPLRDAVACGWGGVDSSDKRDWLCGNIADLWGEDADADAFTVEARLLQVMEDEFDVNLEDDSAFEVAQKIVALRKDVTECNFDTVKALYERFLAMPRNVRPPKVEEVDQDAGSSDEGDDGEDEEMEDVIAPAPRRERLERVVDDDGFELVLKGRRR